MSWRANRLSRCYFENYQIDPLKVTNVNVDHCPFQNGIIKVQSEIQYGQLKIKLLALLDNLKTNQLSCQISNMTASSEIYNHLKFVNNFIPVLSILQGN